MAKGTGRQLWNMWMPRVRVILSLLALGLAIAALVSGPSLKPLPAIFMTGVLFFLSLTFGPGAKGEKRKGSERVYFFLITLLCAAAAWLTAVSLW